MTLKELSEHPELASEEDRKSLSETVRSIKRLGESLKYTLNGVTLESGRTQEEISRSYYVEMMLMSAILESFVSAGTQEYKDITKFVFNYTDKAFIWDVPVTSFYHCLAKLCVVGLIEMTKEDEYNPTFSITEDGRCALRNQTYANLAQSALFNLKTQQLNDRALELSKRSLVLNRLMLVVAISSAIAALLGVCISLINFLS